MSEAAGIAKLEAHVEMILKGQERAELSRSELYKAVSGVDKKVDGLDYRLTTLEHSFNEAKPTLADFIATKNKVSGAGTLGKWLWGAGGFILGAAAWFMGVIELIKNLGK